MSVARSISSWLMLSDHCWPSLSLSFCLITEPVKPGPATMTIPDITLPVCSLQWQVPLTVAVGNSSSVCSESLLWINNRTGTVLQHVALDYTCPWRLNIYRPEANMQLQALAWGKQREVETHDRVRKVKVFISFKGETKCLQLFNEDLHLIFSGVAGSAFWDASLGGNSFYVIVNH